MIKNIKEEVNNIANWIKNYVQNTHSNGVVIGNSGGKDSAVVIALATKALGKEKVLTVGMPCFSINSDLEDANLVAKTFDVKMLEIDLSKVCIELENIVSQELKVNQIAQDISEEGKINIKPRLRMITLYSIARTLNYLVMGTGNACEIFVRLYNKMGR